MRSLSARRVVCTTLEQTLTASDGNEYLVTVTYDHASGIPSDAELYVSEIKEGETGYEEYVAQSAAALGEKPENLAFARPFDITLKNPRTGEEYQPNGNVQVSIELLKDDLNSYASVDVVHIPDGAGEEAQVMDTTVHGESVEFETDGFSVYVLCGYSVVELHYDDYNVELLGNEQVSLTKLCGMLGVELESEADAVVEYDGRAISAQKVDDVWMISVNPDIAEAGTLTVTTGDQVMRIEVEVTGAPVIEGEGVSIASADGVYLPSEAEVHSEVVSGETAIEAVQQSAYDAPAENVAYTVFDVRLENVDTENYAEGFNVALALPEDVQGIDYQLFQVQDGAAVVIEDVEVSEGTLSFTASDFDAFVLRYTLETYYTDAEGTTWRITANYGSDTGIPADAELAVRELDDAEREAYLEQAAQALDTEIDSVHVARAFDIRLVKDDVEYHSTSGEVQVSIQLLDTEVTEDMQVVHMGEEAQVMDTQVQGDNLSFTTDGFSVYLIVEAIEPYAPKTGVVQDLAELSGNYNNAYGFYLSLEGDNKYFTNSINNNSAFIEKGINDADTWYFESAGANYIFYIYTYVDGVKKYMKNTNENLMGLTDNLDDPTKFELSEAATAKFYFKVQGQKNTSSIQTAAEAYAFTMAQALRRTVRLSSPTLILKIHLPTTTSSMARLTALPASIQTMRASV